ncbi:MAG TPA: hypothetical protein VGH51_01215 [Candidatus Angelobacter sp.]|jgi:hypothetical protein
MDTTKNRSNKKWRCIFYLIGIAVFCAFALGQDLSPEMRADIDNRIKLQRNWDARSNSPGTELEAVEVSHTGKGSKLIAMYELRAKGLPPDLRYELLWLPTMAGSPKEIQSTGDVEIDRNDGRVMNASTDPQRLVVPNSAPGEPYRWALVSKDGTHKAFIAVLPNAIQSTNNGCKVNVVRLMPKFELAFVQFSGFPPQSEVNVRGNSAGEIHDFKLTTNAEGYVDTGILPFKAGKSSGTMELQTKTPKCSLKVSFKWGVIE